MKRAQLRAEVVKTLIALGFKPNQYKWTGCSIDIVISGSFQTMRFPAGMSKRALSWELGRLTGWVEVLANTFTARNPENKVVARVKPSKRTKAAANGHATQEAVL